jgi:hypothetical protein
MREHSAPRARRVSVEPDQGLIGTDRYHYADAFEIRMQEPDPRSAEQWIRCAIEQAPWPVRWTVWIAHRHLLRLRLGPRSSLRHVLGWQIQTSQPDLIHLEAVSPLLGRGVIVGRRVDPACAVVTTFVYTRSAAGRLLWAFVAPLHRRIACYLMEHAAAT